MSERGTFDVVIVGGGIVGTSTAHELSRRGVTVAVLERDRLAAAQSGRNWGFVRQQGRSTAELPLMHAANRRWQHLEEELDAPVGWVQGGNLALADTEEAAERYRRWVPVGREHGVDTRLLAPDEVTELLPGLCIPFTAAIHAGSDGHADPVAATRAFATAAERHGTRVLCGRIVREITHAGGRVTGVRTDREQIRAGAVVCAAGVATRGLLRGAGVRLPQSAVRGTVALTAPVAPFTDLTFWAPGLSFRQRADGRLVLATGGGGEVDLTLDAVLQAPLFLRSFLRNHRRLRLRVGRAALTDLRRRLGDQRLIDEPQPDRARVRRSLLRLRQAFPYLAATRIERAWAGLIDSTPDALPVLDRLDALSGLVIASGFSGHGFGLAPAAAQVLADLVTGDRPAFDLTPFRLSRFTERDFKPADAIL